MYINPFLAGIFVTILSEFIVVSLAVIVTIIKNSDKTHENSDK